jgi:hypothetical protein
MGHQMGHGAFSSIRFTQFRVYMVLPEHAVYIIQNPEKWIGAGAYPEMARRLKFCSVCCDVQVTATAERADLRAAGRSGRFLDSVFVFGKRDGAQVRACVRAWRRPP